tara:strand:+ start:1395 stop:2402 length:1008 start_codon:yes stop_codon:yes gene_type:complete
MTKSNFFSLLKILVSIGLGVYLTWYIFDNMSTKDIVVFKNSILNSNPWLITLSLVLAFITYLSRAYRWKYTLHPLGFKSSFKNQYHSLMIGYLVNMTIPRAGEFTRALMLKRSDNIPVAGSFGTIVTERIIDMLILLSIAFGTIFFNKSEAYAIMSNLKKGFLGETNTKESHVSYWILGVLGVVVVVLILNKKLRNKVSGFLRSLKDGVLSIFKVQRLSAYIIHTLLIWGSYLLMFVLPFWALEETASVPISGMLLAFIFGAIGISFTNGGMGAYPLLIGITAAYYLNKMDVSDSLAIGNALGMVIWATQTIFLILLGLVSLVLMPRKYNADEKS